MAMRAQCSLLFSDDDLYSNFILPMKEQRELNNIIIKCLEAYYYDENARNVILNSGKTEEEEVADFEDKTQSIVDNIRSTLALQSFCVNELENTIQDGVDTFTDILNQSSDVMEEQGFVTPKESDEFSAGVPLLTLKTPKETEEIKEDLKKEEEMSSMPYDQLVRMVVNLSASLEDIKKALPHGITAKEETNVVTTEEPKVEKVEVKEEIKVDKVEVKEETKVEEVASEVEEQPKEEDASSSMSDLLSSLF